MTRLLMLSTDRQAFTPGSDTAARLLMQSEAVDELSVIVFSRRSLHLPETKLSEKVTVYPTNSGCRLWYGFDAVKIARKLSGKIDWVTAQDPFETGLVGAWLARRLAARLNLQIHTDFLSPYFAGLSFLNCCRAWLSKRLLPKADSIRVVTGRLKDSLLQSKIITNPAKIFVLPVFIDPSKYAGQPPLLNLKAKYPQFNKIILMASRLAKEKNFDLAIAAFEQVMVKYKQTGLIIVGEGPEKGRLTGFLAAHNLADRVILEPWTNELFSYFQTADLFLLTSYYEGYGRTLLEAALANLPMVTVDVGCAREVFPNEPNVVICPVDDQTAFATAMSSLLDKESAGTQTLRETALKNLLTKDQFLDIFKRSLT